MSREELTKQLRSEIEILLAPISDESSLYNLVKQPLSKIMQDSDYEHAWFLLPLIVCDASCGRYDQAMSACAGLELLKAAAEVFDDIEDADSADSLPSKYGTPLALNAASTLIILGERAFTRLKSRGIDNVVVVNLIDKVNSYYSTACIGQHLDLSLTPEEADQEDIYLRVIEMKSASILECACFSGALLAAANQELIKSFTIFGHNLGMASQIANDIKGVRHLNDIKKRKITLPAIYALSQTDGETLRLLQTAFCKRPSGFLSTPDQIKDLLFSTGAIQYATIKMELYKQQALHTLAKLEQAGVKVDQLKQFLE